MKSKKTILIFGVSSFVGSNLAEFFKKDYKVIGTYYSSPVYITGVTCIPVDVLVRDQVQLALYSFRPDYTVYAVGVSSLIECAKNPSLSEALNGGGLFNVSEFTQRYKSQLVHISNAFVFSGTKENYLEKDTPDPDTAYGSSAAGAEFFVQKNCLNYLIFRCCRFYGKGLRPDRRTFFEEVQRYVTEGKELGCDNELKIGFLDVYYLAMSMQIAFNKEIKNRLFQISSKDSYTYYEFARKSCEIFNMNYRFLSKRKWNLPHKGALTGESVKGKPIFNLDVRNIEGFFKITFPTVEESLSFTFSRFKGVKKMKSFGQGDGGISFI